MLLVTWGLWVSVATPVLAATPQRVVVEATARRQDGLVTGSMTAQVAVREGETSIRLWLYGARLEAPPAALDERNARWVFPGEVQLGGAWVRNATVDGAPAEVQAIGRDPDGPGGVDRAGRDVEVPIPPGEARTVTLRVEFTLRVPHRFGRLGRAGGQLSLAAPWYPLVVDGDAWVFDAEHAVHLTAARGVVLLDGARRTHAQRSGPYVPAAVADHWFPARLPVAAGVEAVLWSSRAPYRPPSRQTSGDEGLVDLLAVDTAGMVRSAVRDVVESARAFGVPVPAQIPIVTVPSRTEMVATASGQVLLSDRIFQIVPLDDALGFHRRALRRALFRHLAEPLAARADDPDDRDWGADIRAAVLVDLDEARRNQSATTPQQLLGVLAFHPAVDQLLYAPQIAFENVYFATIQERDIFRDDPVSARRPRAKGRRLLEAARDTLGEEAFGRFAAMLVNARRPARDALRRADEDVAARLDGWLTANREPLNYRLGERRSERLPDGRYRHTVVVHRDGAQRAEPVEVLVVDQRGNRVTGVWDAPGAVGEVTLESEAPLAQVHVDPRQRLPQSPDIADGHPRADDTTDLPWRPPVLNGFALSVVASEGDVIGVLDFALRRRYNLEQQFGFRLERTRALTGGLVSYGQGFGPKVHTNRRVGLFQVALTFDRLRAGFGGADLGGWRPQVVAGVAFNTVEYSLDPRGGFWAVASVAGGVSFRDDGSSGGTARGGFRMGTVIPLGLVNALVFVGGGGFTAGNALVNELQPLGGASRLRGLETGELLGRGVLFGVAEHRWTLVRDLSWNILHLVWVREISVAAFAGTGVVFGWTRVFRDEDTDEIVVEPTGRTRAGADVGGGLRIHYEYGGVQPGVLVLDLGFPLARAEGTQPVGFYIAFDQFF